MCFYVVTNVAIQGFGRLKLGASLTLEDNGAVNPNLYQTTLNLAALGLIEPIASITFSNPATAGASQTTAIFALSGMPSSAPLRAPDSVTAIPGTNATVRLTWTGSAGATNYNLKRSLTSGSGHITIRDVSNGRWRGIEIEASDNGPGIADVELALRDGYSTAQTLGAGLPGVKRLMDEFMVETEVGVGTTVRAIRWHMPRGGRR